MPEAHERKVKRIMSREWAQIRSNWLNYVPRISHPGQPPALHLSDLAGLDSELSKITHNQVAEVESIEGLRDGLLHDSVFLLHKSSHALGACLTHVNEGMLTWSISNAYQSAFYAMRSIMGVLGVCVIEFQNRHFLVDVWGTSHQRKLRKKGPFIILANTGRNEQRNLWAYFQRTIEQTVDRDDIWSRDLTGQLLNWEYKDFGRQRNQLHYSPSWWPLTDLHVCVTDSTFGQWRSLSNVDTDSDPDFPLLLAFTLVGMACDLMSDIAQESTLIERELDLVHNWLSRTGADLYNKSRAHHSRPSPAESP